jgi:hypothetical protein
MVNGVVHGCDLRSRSEVWCARVPAALGCISALEVCPGSTAVVIGTDRGCVLVFDTRFRSFVSAWRHSARSPIAVIYPYVTLGVRAGGIGAGSSGGGGAQVRVCRQLAVGLGTGEDETSFWSLETGICLRVLRALPQRSHPSDAFRVPFLARISLIGGNVELLLDGEASEAALLTEARFKGAEARASAIIAGVAAGGDGGGNGGVGPGGSEAAATRAGLGSGRHALQGLADEMLLRRHPAHVRAILAPMPTAFTLQQSSSLAAGAGSAAAGGSASASGAGSASGASSGAGSSSGLAGTGDAMDPSRLYAELLAAGVDGSVGANIGGAAGASGGGGLGFVLGGMRGAGAVRRRGPGLGFTIGYRAPTRREEGARVAASTALGAAAGLPTLPGTEPFSATTGAAQRQLQHLYGSGPAEGLPVWMLTAGTDGKVVCWDLDRPRASHTVCGHLPVAPRDGFEGAWARPVEPRFWDADSAPGDAAAAEAARAAAVAAAKDGATRSGGGAGGSGHALPSDAIAGGENLFGAFGEGAAGGATGTEEELEQALRALRAREPEHFLTFHAPDGLSVRRPAPNDALLARLQLPRRVFARAQYAYWFQRSHPVRVCFSVPLTTPAHENSGSGAAQTQAERDSALAANPYLAMKGPVPASTAHASFITAMAWLDLPTRLLVTASKDGLIKVWR